MNVSEIMTRDVKTIGLNATAGEARALMRRGRFRRLPVLENGRLAGIVAASDLDNLPDETIIRGIMRSPVITVMPDDPIEQAGRIMLEQKISVLPVLDGEALVGIITESDLFDALCSIMGVMEPSSRVEVTIDDTPAGLARVMTVLAEQNVRVVSLNSAPPREPGTRRLVIRLATMQPAPVLRALVEAGVDVVDETGPALKGDD